MAQHILRGLFPFPYFSPGSFRRNRGQAQMIEGMAADLEKSVDLSNLAGPHHCPFGICSRNIKGCFQSVSHQKVDGAEICWVSIIYTDGYIFLTGGTHITNITNVWKLLGWFISHTDSSLQVGQDSPLNFCFRGQCVCRARTVRCAIAGTLLGSEGGQED